MSTSPSSLTITESLSSVRVVQGQQFNPIPNPLHSDFSDDYFRLKLSPLGSYLSSITMNKVLTVFDADTKTQIQSFNTQEVNHAAFSQDQKYLAVTNRVGQIKIYQIAQKKIPSSENSNLSQQQPQKIPQKATTQKTLSLINQWTYESSVLNWVAWSLDNKHMFFIKDSTIMTIPKQLFPKDMDGSPKLVTFVNNNLQNYFQQCAAYYIIAQRTRGHLITSSKTGTICDFKLAQPSLQPESLSRPSLEPSPQETGAKNLNPNSGQILTLAPKLSLQQKIDLSRPGASILDLDESQQNILISTNRVFPMAFNQGPSYYLFVLQKQNFAKVSNIQLRNSLLLLPGLMIQAQNVHNYILTFVKGQDILYVSNLLQLTDPQLWKPSANDTQPTSASSSNTQYPTYTKRKIHMPFLLHGIQYNPLTNQIVMGTTGQKNKDQLVFMKFGFNCNLQQVLSQSLDQQEQGIVLNFSSQPGQQGAVVIGEEREGFQKNTGSENAKSQETNNTKKHNIINNSEPNQQVVVKTEQQKFSQQCQCQDSPIKQIFSFPSGQCSALLPQQCINSTVSQDQTNLSTPIIATCNCPSPRYLWNKYEMKCKLDCSKIKNSVWGQSYKLQTKSSGVKGLREVCSCQDGYYWWYLQQGEGTVGEYTPYCMTLKQIQQAISATKPETVPQPQPESGIQPQPQPELPVNPQPQPQLPQSNSTTETNSSKPQVPTPTPIPETPQNQFTSPNKPFKQGLKVIGIILIVLLILFLLVKLFKRCFPAKYQHCMSKIRLKKIGGKRKNDGKGGNEHKKEQQENNEEYMQAVEMGAGAGVVDGNSNEAKKENKIKRAVNKLKEKKNKITSKNKNDKDNRNNSNDDDQYHHQDVEGFSIDQKDSIDDDSNDEGHNDDNKGTKNGQDNFYLPQKISSNVELNSDIGSQRQLHRN